MRCTNQTIIDLETAENGLVELLSHHRWIGAFSIATGVGSLLSAYLTMWCIIPFILSALILIHSTIALGRAEADIALDYFKALGNDRYLASSRVPSPLLATLNGYVRIGSNASFKDIQNFALRKSFKVQRTILKIIKNSKFRRELGY